eukprot:4381083-Pyramimonas_sp.AAC.1
MSRFVPTARDGNWLGASWPGWRCRGRAEYHLSEFESCYECPEQGKAQHRPDQGAEDLHASATPVLT